MPQLDMAAYPPQIFWLVVSFVILLLLMWRVGLPRVRKVLEARQDRISGDLEQAETLRAEAEQALKAYEKALADARAKAHALVAETQATLAAEAAERRATLDAELAERMSAAEGRIRDAREQALANVRAVASEAARAATARLIGVEPSEQASGSAVDSALGGREG